MKRIALLGLLLCTAAAAHAQTALGELEARPAPVARRQCVAGMNAGSLCNENADCPGSTCVDRNIFNISVAVHFTASAAQLTTIQNAITTGSAILFDATDGQAQIGQAIIHNNAFGTTEADMRVYPSTQSQGWSANTGSWKAGGSIHISIDRMTGSVGEAFAHEFLHLAFDPRDEYESRAAGCGAVSGGDSCPIPATVTAGETACLMDNGGLGSPDGEFSEICWGQGDPADPADISGGNHDADNTTEQSVCRSNRSCWDQVVWSWPNTILEPAGAPDPAANGGVATPPSFLVISNTSRGVLVLDESGSMALESPSRMERLKVAANDFIALAETGSELGLVSFATDAETSSGRSRVAIAALGADRTALTNEVNGMAPATRTNIGAGLQVAQDMINTAGGVTGNTYIVLMTDGLNNEPSPQATADADLQAKIDALLAAGIEVYVTCTGSDLGLQSQCSEIATGTGGFYVDSASAAELPESFAELGAYTSGHELIAARSATRTLLLAAPTRRFRSERAQKLAGRFFRALPQSDPNSLLYFVEQGSESALFTVQWRDPQTPLRAVLISPAGEQFDMLPMPQGLFRRVKAPASGDWTIRILNNVAGDFVAKAYSRNRAVNVAGGVRHASVRPGEEIYVYAYPRTMGRALTHPADGVPMLVTRPDGSVDTVLLHDRGRDKLGRGDDVAGDGIFTGVYTDTQMKGAYQFESLFDVDGWPDGPDARPHHHEPGAAAHTHDHDDGFRSPRFMRELRFSAAVADPRDVERTPDDPPSNDDPRQEQQCEDRVEGWWTGGDPRFPRPQRVVFDIQNATSGDLYFNVAPQSNDIGYTIMTRDRAHKLELPENRYCETPCPKSGYPMERDCGKPMQAAHRVRAGSSAKVAWSGMESVGIYRTCSGRTGTCRDERPTKPGTYVVEVCAYGKRSNGTAEPNRVDRYTRATGTGTPQCRQVTFDYPAREPVVVRFTR